MYRVEITNTGDTAFQVKSKDCNFVSDTHGKGMTPPDILLASVGSCLGVYIRKYIESAKLPIDGFVITVEADFCKEPPTRFKDIGVSVALKGSEQLDKRRKKALLDFIKNCPVHNTLLHTPTVSVVLTQG